MTRFLLAVDSVHAAATACDYLAERLSTGDAVVVLTVREPGVDPRDGDDAANVATVRLDGLASVETVARAGEPAPVILRLAAEGFDEVVIGAGGGGAGPDADLGGTARAVVAGADVPVVVLPDPSS